MALLGSDPVRWIALGLLPSVPLAVVVIAHLFLHRVAWLDQAWGPALTLQSLGVAFAVVAAWQLRAVAQGRLARAVVEALHPTALLATGDECPQRGRLATGLSLLCLATIGATGALVGVCLAVLPGLALAGFFVPMAAIVAVEGRDAGAAIGRAARLPRGTTGKGMTSVLLYCALAFLAWLNVLLGIQVGIFLARAFLGMDVSLLARLFGLGNDVFVLGSLVVALLLLDPLWGIHRTLVYLDARLGQSGADLTERWRMLPRRRRPVAPAIDGMGLLLAVFLGTSLLASAPGQASAEDADWEPPRTGLAAYVGELEYVRIQLDEAIDRYPTSGFEDLSTVRALIDGGARRRGLELPDGSAYDVDGTLLVEELPTWIHTDSTLLQARRVSRRLGDAITTARQLADPDWTLVDPEAPTQTLLAQEFAGGEYDVDEADLGGNEFRGGIQERFRSWWESVIRSLDSQRTPPTSQPSGPLFPAFDGRIIVAAVAIVLAILVLVFFLSQSLRIAVRAPEAPVGQVELGGDLPDARQRTPLGWRAHGDKLADEELFDEAVRALFLAILARLDRTREIEYRQERTNGEHLRTFRGTEARLTLFEEATWRFEVAWYSSGQVARADYSVMASTCEPLLTRDLPGAEAGMPLMVTTEASDGR